MEILSLERKDTISPTEVLANHLKTFASILKYGKTVIYKGDIYYIPYHMHLYRIQETNELYAFLCSQISEDIFIYKDNEKKQFSTKACEVDEFYVVEAKKDTSTTAEEVNRKISLNNKIRKLKKKYTFLYEGVKSVYLPEQTFYVKGKTETLFAVDLFLSKVDFKHIHCVGDAFMKAYFQKAIPETEKLASSGQVHL